MFESDKSSVQRDFCEIVGLGIFDLILYAHVLHSHCILTMFHAFRCVFDIVECVLVGLDWVLPIKFII